MNTEKIKVIARGMGIEVEETKLLVLIPAKSDLAPYLRGAYSPLTNAEQLLEIMERLKISIWFDGITWVAQIKNNNRSLEDTINEAVCEAAYEYFKDK